MGIGTFLNTGSVGSTSVSVTGASLPKNLSSPTEFKTSIRDFDEHELLEKFVATRDEKAFEELTRRYAGLVRGVCFQILGNSHDAEEVFQECFFELVRHAGDVHTSLGGWLQRTATSRSLNALRSRSRRKVRERAVGVNPALALSIDAQVDPDLHRIINRALGDLPEDLRVPMMLHFVGGRSQRDVALEMKLNQSTISRRIRDALQQLRETLTQAGYSTAAPAIMVFVNHKSATATETESTELALTKSAENVASGVTLAGMLHGMAMALVPIVTHLLLGGWVSLAVSLLVVLQISRQRPVWLSELTRSLGSSSDDLQAMDLFGTSSSKLDGVQSKGEITTAIFWASFFALLTASFIAGTRHVPWGIVILGTGVTAVYFLRAILLNQKFNAASVEDTEIKTLKGGTWCRFARHVGERKFGLSNDQSQFGWFDSLQFLLIGFASVGILVLIAVRKPVEIVWPAVLLSSAIGFGMLAIGIRLAIRLVKGGRHKISPETHSPDSNLRFGGTRLLIATGVSIVVGLSSWILWNPGTLHGVSLSLAAVQTSILGWMFYRLAAYSRAIQPRLIRGLVALVLGVCFVLNSGVCFANWLR